MSQVTKTQCEMDRSPESERVALKESTNLREGRFSYSEIYEYVAMRSYPEGFTKEDKLGRDQSTLQSKKRISTMLEVSTLMQYTL